MGQGVFELKEARTVIIEHTAVYGEWAANPYAYADIEQPDDFQWRYQDFVQNLLARLPPRYQAVTAARWYDRTTAIIAESPWYVIGLTDGEGCFYLSVIPRRGYSDGDAHPLAVTNLPHAAAVIFESLLLEYPLRVRTSAWTTGPYQPFTASDAGAWFF